MLERRTLMGKTTFKSAFLQHLTKLCGHVTKRADLLDNYRLRSSSAKICRKYFNIFDRSQDIPLQSLTISWDYLILAMIWNDTQCQYFHLLTLDLDNNLDN